MVYIIKLLKPQKELDFPLMKALEIRRSKRKWKEEPLSEQDLSNLLWAACGITKEETKRSKSKRTSPSACNSQAIKIYTTTKDGLFLYDEKNHQLVQIFSKDIRDKIGTQKMMHSAPLGLIYVSDYSKMKNFLFKNDEIKWFFSGTDAAFISQNVYLYCTAAKLSTVILGLVNRNELHEVMNLKEQEKIVFTQVVGNPID
ncbi:nitroreductase family protein [Candidatus Bathyarchaeota archaeon]|nr:nitroreductase family protein [Candidatus Bathyarchaeota archaeon]